MTVDGKFITCERVNESSDAMVIGDIDRGFDMEQVKRLLNICQLTINECKECWAFSLCSSCIKYAEQNNALSDQERLKYCQSSKQRAITKLRNWALIHEMAEIYRRLVQTAQTSLENIQRLL